jgi:protein involved in polysaccharide export with SLBB domain
VEYAIHSESREVIVIKILRILLTVLVLGLPSLATAQQTPPSPAAAQSPVSAGGVATGYRLGVADKVRVIVFNEESLSGEFTVSDSGTLSLPLIGTVEALGRTPADVITDIQSRLANGYLREPKVSMDVLTYRPFYILGEVEKPGEYPFVNGLTVMNAVARAEGYTYRANKKKVFIKRAGESEEKKMTLSPDLKIYPGDTVRIGERYF